MKVTIFEMTYEPDPEPGIDSPPERVKIEFEFDDYPQGVPESVLGTLEREVANVSARTMAAIRRREDARRVRAEMRRRNGA